MVGNALIAKRAGGNQRGQTIRVGQKQWGESRPQFALDAAEMVGEARLPMDRQPITRLPHGALSTALSAGNQAAMAPIGRCQQADQQRVLAKWSRR